MKKHDFTAAWCAASLAGIPLSVWHGAPDSTVRTIRQFSKVQFGKSSMVHHLRVPFELPFRFCKSHHLHDESAELGVDFTLDPTVTPKMDGDRSLLALNAGPAVLKEVFRDPALVGDAEQFCALPANADADLLEEVPCSAGHTACYVSPYGDVYPCVQFPLPSGNVRRTRFVDIWRHSEALKEVRSIRLRDLTTCSGCTHVTGCTRCPGLAYMEGNMRGPPIQDCEKSFARTGIPSTNLLSKAAPVPGLVQIQTLSSCGTVV